MKYRHLVLALFLGLAGTVALLLIMTPLPGIAAPTVSHLFVSTTGSGTACAQNNPCSLSTALNQATGGDAVYLAQGTYTGTGRAVVTVMQTMTIAGGWDGAATGAVARDPDTYPTVLDGQNARRVIFIPSVTSPTLKGLTLQRGNAAGLGGDPTMPVDVGGSVYANGASLTITNCRIVSSTAGFGGGLGLYSGTLTITNSAVLSNTAHQDLGGGTIRGSGGGLFLYHSSATLFGNVVANNVASGTQSYDGGGGMYMDASSALIQGSMIQDNLSTRKIGRAHV